MNERAVEPLNIEAGWVEQQNLVADDGHWQKEGGSQGHGKAEVAHPQAENRTRKSS